MNKILLLEDDARVAQALTVRLQSAHYEVLKVPDPGFGVMLAATMPIDLIISDIWMPVMQGFTFVRRLQSFGLPRIPVIFMSASPTKDLLQTARSLGAVGFFEKPCDTERLLATVQEAITRSRFKARISEPEGYDHETHSDC